MMSEFIIEVSNLKKSFKEKLVVENLDFKVKRGQVFSLLGSNGAGKTTIVRILTTLLSYNAGEILIDGYNIAQKPNEIRKIISLTGQYSSVDELLTGRQNLYFIGRINNVKNYKQKANELLEKFELTQAADRSVYTYSGGMKRKLDISMSLMTDPKIIFLDEPTTGLDPQSRLALWQVIKDLSQAGITIFLTTQYLDEAEKLADYVLILNDGGVATEGTVDEVKQLLPNNVIDLSFDSCEMLEKGQELLQNEALKINADELKLTILKELSIRQITTLLNRLKDNGVEIVKFEQTKPTLEEVFLTFVKGDKKNDRN